MTDVAATLDHARRDPHLAVLEGFHAVKHAVRFGARLEFVACGSADEVQRLSSALAPDIAEPVLRSVVEVGNDVITQATTSLPAGGLVAIAQRPAVDLSGVVGVPHEAPIVLLEDPRRLGNVGACIRVAAAAGAAAVFTTGTVDPWHPDAIRGAAGLHFALSVARLPPATDMLLPGSRGVEARGGRPLVALAVDGAALGASPRPARAILAFGTERDGLSQALLEASDQRVRIPMRDGVASLNLATAVAVTLYAG